MDSDALLANAWASQDGAAQELDRVIKVARKFPDRKSLETVENAVKAYTDRLNSYLDMKERESVQV